MPSHASTAAKVREQKEAHPEMYCAEPGCLWRTGGPRGTPCQKHPVVEPLWTDYEKTLTDLDRYATVARTASRKATTLDDKVGFQRLLRALENARGSLRLMVHQYEDAAKLTEESGDGWPDIPVLAPITARPVALNPAAWGEDEDAPACYRCQTDEDLEEAGFPGQSLWVCPACKASYQHQEALRQEFGAERAG